MNEKIQIDIYKGLPMVLEKVKGVALAAVIGKPSSWLNHKLEHYTVNGVERRFFDYDVELLNAAIYSLGCEISSSLIEYSPEREKVIKQVRELAKIVSMPYIYKNVLEKKDQWFRCRLLSRKPGGKVSSFKEDDILKINMAAMQIANELKSIEFVLK